MGADPQLERQVLDLAGDLMRREGIAAATLPRVAREAGLRQRAVRELFPDAHSLQAAALRRMPASEVAAMVARAAEQPDGSALAVLIEAGHRLYSAPQQGWSEADLEGMIRARSNPALKELAGERIAGRTENVRRLAAHALDTGSIDPALSEPALTHFLMSLSAGLSLIDPVAQARPSPVEWDGLIARIGTGLASAQRVRAPASRPGSRWRLRVEIPERPDALARLTAAFAALDVYTCDVRVEDAVDGRMRVMYLALLAPPELSADVLLGAAHSAGTNAYVQEGRPEDAQDFLSRTLDGATRVVRHPKEAPAVAAALVGADRFEVIDALVGIDEQAQVLRLQWTEQQHVLLYRDWGPFTATEQVRASALLRLAATVASRIGDAQAAGWIEETRAGTVWVRLARPEDAAAVAEMHERSSERTRYQRYFSLREWRDLQLRRLAGGHRGATLVVVTRDRRIVGLGNVFPESGGERGAAEVALLIEDAYQGKGVGRVLLNRMLHVGRRLGFTEIMAHVLADNRAMRHLFDTTGLEWNVRIDSGVIEMRAALDPAPVNATAR